MVMGSCNKIMFICFHITYYVNSFFFVSLYANIFVKYINVEQLILNGIGTADSVIGFYHLFVGVYFLFVCLLFGFFSSYILGEIKTLHFLKFRISFTLSPLGWQVRLMKNISVCLGRLLPLAIMLHVICKYIGAEVLF